MSTPPRFMTIGWAAAISLASLATALAQDNARKDATPPTGTAKPSDSAPGDRKPSAMPTSDDKKPATAATRIEPGESSEPGGDKAIKSAVVLEPSQGRPIFITPDETFYFVMRLPDDLKGDVNFTLVHAREPSIRVPLWPTTPPSYVKDYCSLVLKTPEDAKPGLYDIEVRSKAAAHLSRHCVKVVDKFKTRFRFVHLSSMNVGDLTAPDFDETLPKEINILAPEFIIATGDYTQWARTKDDASSWQRVLKYFEKFDAPVFMLCGLHDHEASFSRFVASKPIGTIDYGQYHGLLLLDHAANPIDQDYAQLKWIDEDLKRNRNKQMNFLCANSDELALLDIWRERGDLKEIIDSNKIRMFITGGATDWDKKEFAEKLAGADSLCFIRTHQSSTCLRDRATGVSHYRVVEIDGDRVAYVYSDDTTVEILDHSVPAGRLRAFPDGPNDGSSPRIAITYQNALNQAFPNCRAWLRVAKKDGQSAPVIAAGRIEQTIDAGKYWACEVAFDLPDKGGIRLMLANDPTDLPPPVPVTVALDGPRTWSFTPQTTDFGLSYFKSSESVSLQLTNTSKSAIACWPVIRVNGDQIHPDRTTQPRLPVTLEPGKTISMPLVLNLRRISPGKHLVQVHFLEDPLNRIDTFEVQLKHQ